jgi:hypothetical protein
MRCTGATHRRVGQVQRPRCSLELHLKRADGGRKRPELSADFTNQLARRCSPKSGAGFTAIRDKKLRSIDGLTGILTKEFY